MRERASWLLWLGCVSLLALACSSGPGDGRLQWVMRDGTYGSLEPVASRPPTDEVLVWHGSGGEFLLMDPATGTRRTLATPFKWPLRPSWSPDRTRVACSGDHEGKTKIAIASTDGTWRLLDLGLSKDYGEVQPVQWSPDGTHIAFLAHDINDLAHGAYVAEMKTGKVTRLKQGGGRFCELSWAPSGRRLAVATVEKLRVDMSGDEIDVSWRSTLLDIDLESGRAKALRRGLRNTARLSWNPSGGSILYHDQGKGLFVLDLATGREHAIPTPRGHWSDMQWSPDGSELLMTTMRVVDKPGVYDVTGIVNRLRPDGSIIASWERPDQITEIRYGPQGKRLVRQHMGSKKILVTALDGSGEKVIASDLGVTDFYWAPRH